MINKFEFVGNFIFLDGEYTSRPKFPQKERESIKSIVATFTIKLVSDIFLTEYVQQKLESYNNH